MSLVDLDTKVVDMGLQGKYSSNCVLKDKHVVDKKKRSDFFTLDLFSKQPKLILYLIVDHKLTWYQN